MINFNVIKLLITNSKESFISVSTGASQSVIKHIWFHYKNSSWICLTLAQFDKNKYTCMPPRNMSIDEIKITGQNLKILWHQHIPKDRTIYPNYYNNDRFNIISHGIITISW